MKKIPCRAMARKVAGPVRPMVCSIMLLMTIQPERQRVRHWSRRAVAPYWMTSGSSRKRAIKWGASRDPRVLMASRKTVESLTQKKKPSFTR